MWREEQLLWGYWISLNILEYLWIFPSVIFIPRMWITHDNRSKRSRMWPCHVSTQPCVYLNNRSEKQRSVYTLLACRPLGGVDGVSGASTRNLSIKTTVAPVCHQHISLSNNLCSRCPRCSRWHLIRALRWRTRANVTTIEGDRWSPMDTVQPSLKMSQHLSIGRSLIMTLEQFKSCISTCLKLFSSLNIFSRLILSPFNFAIVGC